MNEQSEQPAQGELQIGDRIHIQQGSCVIPNLLGRAATIVEIFRVPLDSCMVRIDGDPNQTRTWFVYRDEIAVGGK